MITAYYMLQIVLLPLIVLVYLGMALAKEKYRPGFFQRLTLYPPSLMRRLAELDHPIWFHAVSVGEFRALQPLVEAFQQERPEVPLVVTTVTRTGQELARRELPPHIPVFYLPLDLFFLVRRAYSLVKPRAVLVMETEIWPALIDQAAQLSIPVVMVNGRLSEHSADSMYRFRGLFAAILERYAGIAMQTEEDARRLKAIGAPVEKVRVCGNFKFEQAVANAQHVSPRAEQVYQFFASWQDRPLLVFGSTHPGEDRGLLEVYRTLLSVEPRLALVIAPRHPERRGEIQGLCEELGLRSVLRSAATEVTSTDSLVILDSIGELSSVYRLADLVVIAGSFVPHGGQNILEPIAFGKLTFCGPHMDNFKFALDVLKSTGAVEQVESFVFLRDRLTHFLTAPQEAGRRGERGREALQQNVGSVARTMEYLDAIIGEPSARPSYDW